LWLLTGGVVVGGWMVLNEDNQAMLVGRIIIAVASKDDDG
jgi:hypothetical protein